MIELLLGKIFQFITMGNVIIISVLCVIIILRFGYGQSTCLLVFFLNELFIINEE